MYENYESTETNSLMRYFQSVSWIAIKESLKKYKIFRAFWLRFQNFNTKFAKYHLEDILLTTQ